jgi:hypothetical protein
MLEVDTLLNLGLPNQLVSVWQVFLYIIIMVFLLLFGRSRLCLLVTYLFAYYLAFLIYWGDFIIQSGSMMPFAIYALSGLAIVVLFAASSYSERTKTKEERG